MSETITLTAAIDGFAFTALHAQPEGARKGGIVVIQEIFGLDQYVQADVARWAALGFEVLAPSIFDRAEPGFVAEHDPQGFQTGVAYVQQGRHRRHAVGYPGLHRRAGPARSGVRGRLLPGRLAGLAGGRQAEGPGGGAAYYGSMIAANADLPLNAPVVVHLGRKDGHIPADEVKAKVEAAHPDVPVYIYENSGHGFNNDGRPDSDLADAELARARTLELFVANGAA
jgi:carboxymethylenebutenolidase